MSLISLLVPSNYWSIKLVDSHPLHLWDTEVKYRLGTKNQERLAHGMPGSPYTGMSPLRLLFHISVNAICSLENLICKQNTCFIFNHDEPEMFMNSVNLGNLPNISSESKLECSWVLGCRVPLLQASLQEQDCLITCPVCIYQPNKSTTSSVF